MEAFCETKSQGSDTFGDGSAKLPSKSSAKGLRRTSKRSISSGEERTRSTAKRRRSYISRYAEFWGSLDWKLPDRVLAMIWQIDRGNLRARRLRLDIDPPRWTTAYHVRLNGFKNAVAAEEAKAAAFVGPRPDRAVRRRAVAVLEVA